MDEEGEDDLSESDSTDTRCNFVCLRCVGSSGLAPRCELSDAWRNCSWRSHEALALASSLALVFSLALASSLALGLLACSLEGPRGPIGHSWCRSAHQAQLGFMSTPGAGVLDPYGVTPWASSPSPSGFSRGVLDGGPRSHRTPLGLMGSVGPPGSLGASGPPSFPSACSPRGVSS